MKKQARTFAGVVTEHSYEAECAIDRKVEALILAERIKNIQPVHHKFWSLPRGILIAILKQGMNVRDRVQPYAYQGPYGAHGFYHPQSDAATPTDLSMVDRPPWFSSEGD